METVGRYRLLRKVAHGGMAEIFLAEPIDDGQLRRQVVVKRILPQLAHEMRFVAMFLNEAQLAAHMHHENIVQVFEFGEQDGRLFMVMEFVDGLDCWRFAKRLYRLDVDVGPVALYVVRGVLAALAYAHGLRDVNGRPMGVVHRDLSPSNVYLSRLGHVKLGDFGIAQVDSDRFRPIQFIPKGKYGYMAPEQVEGRPVDARADLYSAGVVLAELLLGKPLFEDASRLTIAKKMREGHLERLEREAGIPPDLRAVLERALAFEPDRRFPDAAAFGAALEQVGDRLQWRMSRARFASIVERAIKAVTQSEAADVDSDFSAMARSMAGEEVVALQVTRPDGGVELDQVTAPGEDATPHTLDFDQVTGESKYWAVLDDGHRVGPTAFAHIVEMIYNDKIGPETAVSKDGRTFLPAHRFEELRRHLPSRTPVLDAPQAQAPKRRGFLDVDAPASVLLTLAAHGDSGVLLCESDGRRKEIYLRGGQVVYAASNEAGDLLGEYLVSHGVIERRELEMALALLPKFHGHLGDTLIALGLMTAAELFSHITGQITGRITELMGWNTGVYEFFEGVEVRKEVLEVQVDVMAFVRDYLLAQAARVDGARVFSALQHAKVRPTELVPMALGRLHFPEDVAQAVRSIDNWVVVSETPFHEAATAAFTGQVVFVAVESGLWATDAPELPWRQG